MISESYDINAFIRAVREKDDFEIISLANQEATAAWRVVCRLGKAGEAANAKVDRYAHALEELIWCLRQPVTHRPFKISKALSDQFHQLQQKTVLQQNDLQLKNPAVPLQRDRESAKCKVT
ncbi:MAG: hypothetical protein R6U38_02150 [Desulfatiglandaceae bacterium]